MKIMTLNLNLYGTKHGTWPDRLRLIAESLSALPPDGPTTICNGHLSSSEPNHDAQAREALSYVRHLREPALLLGDFNATPDKPSMQSLARAGWTDLWRATHDGEPGLTFESDRPTIRIDYAWANPALCPRVRDVDLVTPPTDADACRLSDHHELLVTIE